ncbi:MAG TPA: tryptophan synthase subunit alpha [Gammaproteobacteria bacterium]|nr:tryptophan synthase subunit alpha [Gammaproteobacteria bacterium]
MNRITRCFATLKSQQRKALIPYITAGDPEPQATLSIMHTLVEAGADMIELGVPFSDPMADGPVIQAAHERALEQGMNLSMVLDQVRQFRDQEREQNTDTPVILMGYMNPVEAYGTQAFATEAAQAGVDGVLLVDMPPEEAQELITACQSAGLACIYLVSPTTNTDRLTRICTNASGFIYYVSIKGVTGATPPSQDDLATRLATIREHTDLPVGVGFGIRDAESARAVAQVADAVIVGSALVDRLAKAATDREQQLKIAHNFIHELRQALDNGDNSGKATTGN